VERQDRQPHRGTAVVLGASMAGLLTARALADHYQRVIVVDRDPLAPTVSSEPRRGVPQGRHAHGVLASGMQVIEALLPGATADLTAAGAIPMSITFAICSTRSGPGSVTTRTT